MTYGWDGSIGVFGVTAFVVGILALAALIIRRDKRTPLSAADYTFMFVGIAGPIISLAVLFLRF